MSSVQKCAAALGADRWSACKHHQLSFLSALLPLRNLYCLAFITLPNPLHSAFKRCHTLCVCVSGGNRCYFALLSTGGELLASAGDEQRAHRASLSAVLPAGLGTSCSGHHCSGHRLARRIRMVDPQRVRAGARRRVSATAYEHKMN